MAAVRILEKETSPETPVEEPTPEEKPAVHMKRLEDQREALE